MWIAKLKDGTLKTQESSDVPFKEISHLVSNLGYKYNNSVVWLPKDLFDYRYGGSASSALGSASLNVDSYWIQGTFNSDFRKIMIRFYNNENKVEVEVS